MIRVEALPAGEGDCLWVEWDDSGRRRRMLIDGGTPAARQALTARFARQPSGERDFELVVCTHIDDDHIGGLLDLLDSPPDGFTTRDLWFNGYDQLVPPDLLGKPRAERFAALLAATGIPWNAAAGGRAIAVPASDSPPPVFRLPGLTLTLLSPTWERLERLRTNWDKWRAEQRARQAPEPPADLLGSRARIPWRELARDYTADTSPANGASIAFCAEHAGGGRVLFGADAHAEVLVESLRRLRPGGRHRIDLCKVPHHGSAHNLSPALLAAIECDQWLIATDGWRQVRGKEARYRPGEGCHPSLPTMARLILAAPRPTFWFNYRVASTERYADAYLALQLGFRAEHPPPGSAGIAVMVGPGTVTRADQPR
ncbi:MBL fold metallo-hydrolase [Nonomuraea fuscirosea]|uniref:ComEC/Rec2 family competence protein n=1 Tax=Nonomuraea fuscirosea TaxID=1291556 RepID=UPI002DDC80D1|nr:MBL fold metallo-hydrolase [Nonomuraea fuscirosea]WSA57414.1 MBL fold metallo-hydrolase [Nonomuraea fuscirosea]